MGVLDELLGEFESNAGKLPQVNPPEAAVVLAEQTTPEVAGLPEPPAADEKAPAPTAKPAAVLEAEAAKPKRTRKPRAEPAASEAAPEPAAAAPSESQIAGVGLTLFAAMQTVRSMLPPGTAVTISSSN